MTSLTAKTDIGEAEGGQLALHDGDVSQAASKPEHTKNVVLSLLFAAALLVLGLWAVLRPPDIISEAERRELAQPPALSYSSIKDGSYFRAIEAYLLDQFPMRSRFMAINAAFDAYLLMQGDPNGIQNGIYVVDGIAAELFYDADEGKLLRATERAGRKITAVRDMYFSAMNAYVSIIPDKAYFLSEKNGYPAADYDSLRDGIRRGCSGIEYIELFDALSVNDYYRTDTHWRQERLFPVVERLATAMGRETADADDYTHNTAYPFEGVYYHRASIPLYPDTLEYLTSDVTQNAVVRRAVPPKSNYDVGKYEDAMMYFTDLQEGKDPYDLFLGGAATVVSIENSRYNGEPKTLYLFGDSYARSVAPLLLDSYSKIYLIDLRYISASRLSDYIEFDENGEALFLYCVQTILYSSQLNAD